MMLLAWFGLFIMGIVLGLMGAGGAILTLPILVYGFHIPLLQATLPSMLIVGSTALWGAFQGRKSIRLQQAIFFALGSVSAVGFVRSWIVPALPEMCWGIALDTLLLYLLCALMIAAGLGMIRTTGHRHEHHQQVFCKKQRFTLIWIGAIVGCAMGLLGAGGGFLMIPVLVHMVRMPLQEAIPTSLCIIAFNASMGLMAGWQALFAFDVVQLIAWLVTALAGMSLGISLRRHIPAYHLKKAFGAFLVIVAFLMMAQTLFS